MKTLRSVTVAVAMFATAASSLAAVRTLSSFRTASFREAVSAARGGNGAGANKLFVTYTEAITPAGQHFVPVSFFVPAGAGLAADASYTFFGVLERSGAAPLYIEEPAKLLASKGDFYFDRTLMLAPGDYQATFGLALNGTPVATATRDLSVKGLTKESSGPRRLLLSKDIRPLDTPQDLTDPFSYGGTKVVPESDGAFRAQDELWYFVEILNPGRDAQTQMPKTSVALSIVGETSEGKNVKVTGKPTEMRLDELKGMPGHYALGASIPLTKMKPGQYTFALTVTDLTNNQSTVLEEPFRIVE